MGHGPESTVGGLGGTPQVDPALLARPGLRAALAGHDIGAVFRVLEEVGWSQREIGRATGMSQSCVSEIRNGRQVIDYRVLVRIADGLGIPRELMNLGPAEDSGSPYADEGALSDPTTGEVSEEMYRRVLLATAGIALVGRAVPGLGELAPLPRPAPVPLPSRLLPLHVEKVRDLTQRLCEASSTYGSDPYLSSAAAAQATRLLDVPGAEPVTRALMTAVAELHIHAAWSAFDAGLANTAMYHYTRGLELANQTADPYLQTVALNRAGLLLLEHGHPNDGLKLLQCGQLTARNVPADDGRTVVVGEGSPAALEACARADSATALVRLGHPGTADAELATALELWQATPTDRAGDLDYVSASLQLERGRLDLAEPFAVASVRRWESGSSQRRHTISGILLATIHIRAGEPDGARLAHGAITGVTKLSSTRARRRLHPLVAALQTRPSTEHRELARMAHHIATTRV